MAHRLIRPESSSAPLAGRRLLIAAAEFSWRKSLIEYPAHQLTHEYRTEWRRCEVLVAWIGCGVCGKIFFAELVPCNTSASRDCEVGWTPPFRLWRLWYPGRPARVVRTHLAWFAKRRERAYYSHHAFTTCAVSLWESEEFDERPHALILATGRKSLGSW